MYVCMYVCIDVCIDVCMSVCVCMYVCMYTYIKEKCTGYRQNDTGPVQELLANVLRVLSAMQTENEKSNEKLVARLRMEKERKKNYKQNK